MRWSARSPTVTSASRDNWTPTSAAILPTRLTQLLNSRAKTTIFGEFWGEKASGINVWI